MNDDASLSDLLRRLRDVSPQSASGAAEERLRLRFGRRQQRHSSYWVAAVVLAGSLSWFLARRAVEPVATMASTFADSDFVALPYGQSDVPLEHAAIVRVQVQSASGAVTADLLVGQDGVARAVRYNH
jgi:hypothetical protein